MESNKQDILCASSEYLYDFFISNHKNIERKHLEEEYVSVGEKKLLQKLIKHFLENNYPETFCLVIREGYSLIESYVNKEISWIFNEYEIVLNDINKKNKKDFYLIVIPFEEEFDLISFKKEISKYFFLDFGIWKEKKISYEVE